MKVCPQCQTDHQDTAKWCKNCGLRFEPKKEISEPFFPPPSKVISTPAGIALGVFLMIASCGVVAIVISKIPRPAPRASSTPINIAPSPEITKNLGTPQERTPPQKQVTPEPADTPPLALLASRGQQTSEVFITVEGQVTNISGEPIESLMVLVTHYDRNKQFITTSQAMIAFNPLMPGQTSPFKSITRYNPLMASYDIQFKHVLGKPYEYVDKR